MSNLFIATGCACFAVVWETSGIPFKLKRWLKRNRLKPLDCAFCLAWWLGLLSTIYFGKNWLEVIYTGSISAIIAAFITKNLNK